jgi:hypothetical protein
VNQHQTDNTNAAAFPVEKIRGMFPDVVVGDIRGYGWADLKGPLHAADFV